MTRQTRCIRLTRCVGPHCVLLAAVCELARGASRFARALRRAARTHRAPACIGRRKWAAQLRGARGQLAAGASIAQPETRYADRHAPSRGPPPPASVGPMGAGRPTLSAGLERALASSGGGRVHLCGSRAMRAPQRRFVPRSSAPERLAEKLRTPPPPPHDSPKLIELRVDAAAHACPHQPQRAPRSSPPQFGHQ